MISILNSQNWLEKRKILSTRADVYSTKVARPHFYLTNTRETLENLFELQPTELENTFVNPSIYNLQLKNISEKAYLTFTDSFSPQWIVGPKFSSNLNFSFSPNISIPQDNKFENEAGGNVFIIDKEFIQNVAESYETNSDGSINASVSIYYSPQKQLVWGNYITGATLLLIVFFYFWLIFKNKKQLYE